MPRRTVATLLLLAVACGNEPVVPDRLTGVVTEVRPSSGAVEAFTVETTFEAYEILIDPRRDYGFDLRHLDDHRATGDPVVVRVEQRDDAAYALSIEDG